MLKKTVQDAAYVAVGLGVIGFQRAQVRRQEFLKQLRGQQEETRSQIGRLARQVEERVDPMLDGLQDRLPSPARGIVQQARQTAKRLSPTLA